MPVIAVRNVVKTFAIPSVRRETLREHVLGLLRPRRFEALRVLDAVSFDVREGETLGIMGRNGSGKSTLLKIVSGIYQPDCGTVTSRAPITPILELGVGWNPELDAIDNILLIGTVMGLSLPEIRASIDEILEFAELGRFARLELKHYSTGMAARLAYAVAFKTVRPVLILDEIFAVGDASFQARCEERCRALRAAGHTIVLVSHDPGTIATFCDRALLLEGGRVLLDDRADRVADAYARLLGTAASAPQPAMAPSPSPVAASIESEPGVPKVSVLIPCYDLGQYLDEAVDSVLAQTFSDLEILIVDDGSTDPGTIALLQDYRRPKTRVLRSGHRGLPGARNLALESARGQYVCCLDADDKLEPTFLEKTIPLLDGDPSLSFVSCWLRTFGEEDWVWKQDRCDLAALLAECTVATPALVRRDAVLSVGGYDPDMQLGYEDWDLWIGLVERGHRGTIVPEVLFRYRRRRGSMTSVCSRPEVHMGLLRYMVDKHRSSFEANVFPVLLQKEEEQWNVASIAHALEMDLVTRLAPEVERRRAELESLGRKLSELRAGPAARADAGRAGGLAADSEREVSALHARLTDVGAEIQALRRENASLRASTSWKLTGPLRALHGWLLRFTGGA